VAVGVLLLPRLADKAGELGKHAQPVAVGGGNKGWIDVTAKDGIRAPVVQQGGRLEGRAMLKGL